MSEEDFVFQTNLDWMTDPEFLQLWNPVVDLITTNWLATCVYEESQANKYICTDLWSIYSTASWNLVYQMPSNQPIYNIIWFNTWLIWFYHEWNELRLWHILKANTNAIAWNPIDITLNYWSFTPAKPTITEPYCVAINDSDDFLYFICWNRVYLWQTNLWQFFESNVVFEDIVVWLTKNWPLYSIYLRNWRKYFRNWFDEYVEWYVDLNQPILWVYNNKNVDYVFSQLQSSIYCNLYASQWQSFQLLKSARFFYDNSLPYYKFAYRTTYYWNNTVGADKSWLYMFNDDIWWIDFYWNKIQWLKKSHIHVADKTWAWVRLLSSWFMFVPIFEPNLLYFSYEDENWAKWIARIRTDRDDNDLFVSQWYIITRKYDFWVPFENRTIEYLFRVDTPSDTLIDVQVSVNSWNFTTVWTLSWTDKVQRILQAVGSTPFYEIQRKFVLNSSNSAKTPKIYSVMIKNEKISN